MTLTVRLDTVLASALDRYNGERGVTKSHIVQEVLSEYFPARASRRPAPVAVSENYLREFRRVPKLRLESWA